MDRITPGFSILTFFICLLVVSGLHAQQPASQVSQSFLRSWKFRKVTDSKTKNQAWLPAHVPGTVFSDLLASKLISDPFSPSGTEKVQWVEKADWEYKCTFRADKKLLGAAHINLDLAGLDTYARVYLNDSLILRANDMFIAWDIPVKQFLKAGENTLRIYFESSDKKALTEFQLLPYILPANDDRSAKKLSMFTRKAAFHYGGDGTPRLVGCGITRAVSLQSWGDARIRSVHYIQNSMDLKLARLTAVVEIEGGEDPANLGLELSCPRAGLKHVSRSVIVKPGIHEFSLNFDIEKPLLWWPNGSGKAELYEMKAALRPQNGPSVDSLIQSIGIRTIELVNKADSSGHSFYFKVNGVSLFMKGASIQPQELVMTNSGTVKSDQIIQLAVESNMNMLRISGDGEYGTDYLYNLADRRGILIWQDFMFSGRMYPADSSMVRIIRKETAFTVRRLRNHPSLALWCGNNEIDQHWHKGSWEQVYKFSGADSLQINKDYRTIFQNILPAGIRRYDAGRIYISSSGLFNASLRTALGNGDFHETEVWNKEEPVEEYTNRVGRFMSAFGFKSFPALRTMQTYKIGMDVQVDSSKSGPLNDQVSANSHMLHYLESAYKLPQNSFTFWYESQLQQGEAVKAAIEAQRRARNYCMGSLYWHLNEYWPGTSFSAIDYAGRNKAMYYFAKTAFKPILVSPVEKDGKLQVYIVSDQLRELNALLKIQFLTIEGDVVMEKKMNVLVYPNSSHIYYTAFKNSILKGLDNTTVIMKTSLEKEGQVVADNILYFAPVKNLPLEIPEVSYQVQKAGRYYWLTIKSYRLAKNIYLDTKGAECVFSDNFFDLLPGESRIVLVKTLKVVPDLKKILTIETLNSMAEP